MKDELRTLRQVKVDYSPREPEPDQVKELVALMNTMQDQLTNVTREYQDLKWANGSLQKQKGQLETTLSVIATKFEANEAVVTTLDDIVRKKIKQALKLVKPNSESIGLTSHPSTISAISAISGIISGGIPNLYCL